MTCIIFLFLDLPEDYKQKWESFVSGTLAEINKKNAIEFVSISQVLSFCTV